MTLADAQERIARLERQVEMLFAKIESLEAETAVHTAALLEA